MLSWLARHILPQHGAILAYHGITDAEHPSAPLVHVPAEQLREGLALLQSLGRIVPLSELLERVARGMPTRGLFALTFDDAYESVLRVALPILREHAAPATVFPVSAWVQTAGRFWWDRLEDLAPHANAERWAAVEDAVGVPRGAGLEAMRAQVLRGGGRLPEAADRALEALEAHEGRATTMRSVGWEELRALARDPLIAIGPHTVSHACLKYLPDDDVVSEIRRCADALHEMGVAAEPVLAVPYGVGDGRTVGLARRAGMAWSLGVAPCTLRGAGAEGPVPRFAMSRRRRGPRFEAQLSGGPEVLKRVLGQGASDWA